VIRRVLILSTLFIAVSGHWGVAGESGFSLNLTVDTLRKAAAVEAAQEALWNDPMVRLMLAMDAEVGHVMLGQPGSRTPPLISIGVGPGVSPHVIAAAIERSLSHQIEPPAAFTLKWNDEDKKDEGPTPPPIEEELALGLGRLLEQQVGATTGLSDSSTP